MNTRIVAAALLVASSLLIFGQAEQVKKKAKDLKRDVETKQTNRVDRPNPPKQ